MKGTATPALERLKDVAGPIGPGGDGGYPGPWDGPGEGAAAPPVSPAKIGVWLLAGAITILFASFTSTYLARRAETDWRALPLPPVLWVNTAVLMLSSVSLERAKALGRQGDIGRLRSTLALTTILGVAFLAGQILVWKQLVAAGVYLATNPHSSFFYLLTGAHGAHLIGGIGALVYVLWKVRRLQSPAAALTVVDPAAAYWHFLDGLWIYLFILLFSI